MAKRPLELDFADTFEKHHKENPEKHFSEAATIGVMFKLLCREIDKRDERIDDLVRRVRKLELMLASHI